MKEIKGIKVLEKADFEKFCPSFYQTEAHEKMSDKYRHVNTRDIAVMLYEKGWLPVFAKEQRSNKVENRGFNRHMVRFSNPDYITNDGDMIQLVGTNSHNGIAAFNFNAGIWRKVCSNGLVAQTSNFGNFRVKHMGDIQTVVFGAVAEIANNATKIASNIEDMKAIELTEVERNVFASTAHEYIYGEDNDNAPIQPERLLVPRRHYDRDNNLWNVFNRIQENAVKGGIRGYNRETRRRVTTREIRSIDKDMKLNKALWAMAERLKEHKLAA